MNMIRKTTITLSTKAYALNYYDTVSNALEDWMKSLAKKVCFYKV